MNSIKVRDFLQIVTADDAFIINVKSDNRKLYYGYSHESPEEIQGMRIESIYIDWPSEALGITVVK